jgi:hypothetical protein
VTDRALNSAEARELGLDQLDEDEARVLAGARELLGPLIESFMALPLDAVPVDHARFDRAPEL